MRELEEGIAVRATEDAAPAFVAVSRFTVANGADMVQRVKDAFRVHLVDGVDGFVRMDVISPLDDPAEIWLLTYWRDAPSFEAWHHSHRYKDSHQAIPKGLKLVRGSFELRYFEHIAS